MIPSKLPWKERRPSDTPSGWALILSAPSPAISSAFIPSLPLPLTRGPLCLLSDTTKFPSQEATRPTWFEFMPAFVSLLSHLPSPSPTGVLAHEAALTLSNVLYNCLHGQSVHNTSLHHCGYTTHFSSGGNHHGLASQRQFESFQPFCEILLPASFQSVSKIVHIYFPRWGWHALLMQPFTDAQQRNCVPQMNCLWSNEFRTQKLLHSLGKATRQLANSSLSY
jgi:hypothetical protein